jgi:6-pyruvoyltetrahydropterin/6-carboxytetrahydropterin synthase
MRAHLTRRYRFSAAHRLHCPEFSEERNREVYGKCNNPHGHGHNYFLEVTVAGPVDEHTGMVMNMVDLDAVVRREVVDRFDLMNLNLDEAFQVEMPTTENLCRAVYRLLAERTGSARLERVRIEETSNNAFEYSGDREPQGRP